MKARRKNSHKHIGTNTNSVKIRGKPGQGQKRSKMARFRGRPSKRTNKTRQNYHFAAFCLCLPSFEGTLITVIVTRYMVAILKSAPQMREYYNLQNEQLRVRLLKSAHLLMGCYNHVDSRRCHVILKSAPQKRGSDNCLCGDGVSRRLKSTSLSSGNHRASSVALARHSSSE